ncbi:hypothetical protein [Microbacterium azadirachtae]|uniref:Uncharacterized protein n=1 Tax=Microbacterium azadirachtae TaxID=582680 RepID=A0A1I6I446_9MICO|nr:hypothetical protein [Microbacterium azadirachtae]SFR61483.1 hypothetical protein SAMN04488591_2408 [Microbacterium azadirachtae]
MSTMTGPRFEMRRLTESEWLILDDRYESTDARHTVACVSRVTIDQVDVVWLRPVTGRRRFATVADVLEAVRSALSAADPAREPA